METIRLAFEWFDTAEWWKIVALWAAVNGVFYVVLWRLVGFPKDRR